MSGLGFGFGFGVWDVRSHFWYLSVAACRGVGWGFGVKVWSVRCRVQGSWCTVQGIDTHYTNTEKDRETHTHTRRERDREIHIEGTYTDTGRQANLAHELKKNYIL